MDNGACSYRRYLEGDEAAFEDIVNELFDNLVFFINRYVHDLPTAEDLAIDTFTELIVHKRRYDFRVSLKTYLFMIGRSRALTFLKRRKPTVPYEAVGEPADHSFEELLLREEQKQLVNAALSRLPEEMRIAVHLIYFEELSYEEAARVMKKNRKQVDNLLYRAKKELRIILRKEEVLL
ncbi:MAG: RNA polymerase sigma factor [Ruminococcaceae bacterium]|nr:RNA polymerase sigma factor [Oscillospiraceae bacterium]